MGLCGTAAARPDSADCGNEDYGNDVFVRLFDIVVASILLFLLLPVMALIALAIVVDSRGPILYGCYRIGRYGRPFRMLKFRKMRVDAQGPPLTVGSDERFTRFGRLLAKSKLDEVPQLWNVLKGDMSLVGPRPEDQSFVSLLPSEYNEILSVPPGITGLSQLAFAKESQLLAAEDVHGYYVERLLPQKISLDRLYARKRSLRLNLQILLWTLVVVSLIADIAVNRQTGRLTVRRREGLPEHRPEPVSHLDLARETSAP
jgi:lipopolysaccharide/colanic/teichoic acid biosynthesis glycosyltransferase